VYKGSSPGYVPTAYPQIARALEDLANNIPEELNLEVEKGYALTTDGVYATDFDVTSYDISFMFGAMIAAGIVSAVITYIETGDPVKSFVCGAVVFGTTYLIAMAAIMIGGAPLLMELMFDWTINITDLYGSVGICASITS